HDGGRPLLLALPAARRHSVGTHQRLARLPDMPRAHRGIDSAHQRRASHRPHGRFFKSISIAPLRHNMDALESFEEIAEHAIFHVNPKTRQRQTKKPGCKWGHAIAPNLKRSKVASEKKKQPIATKPPPAPTLSPMPAKLGRSFSDYRTL